MQKVFEQLHAWDRSAHLIEQLTSLAQGEKIIDESPLTTVERVWNDFVFIKRGDRKMDSLRIEIHIDSEWKATTHKKVTEWETGHITIDEQK